MSDAKGGAHITPLHNPQVTVSHLLKPTSYSINHSKLTEN